MSLFVQGDFRLSAGGQSTWKIDCDALTTEDIETLAHIANLILPPFGDVLSVPRGGDRLANAMWKYKTEGPLLVVDDVYTTGKSIRQACKNSNDLGLVIFTRSPVPSWVYPIFYASIPVMQEDANATKYQGK